MKLGPVTNLTRERKRRQKKLTFFEFLVNLEHSGGWIPDTESAKVMFSVIVTFCLTKTENRTKKSLTQLSHYCFE